MHMSNAKCTCGRVTALHFQIFNSRLLRETEWKVNKIVLGIYIYIYTYNIYNMNLKSVV